MCIYAFHRSKFSSLDCKLRTLNHQFSFGKSQVDTANRTYFCRYHASRQRKTDRFCKMYNLLRYLRNFGTLNCSGSTNLELQSTFMDINLCTCHYKITFYSNKGGIKRSLGLILSSLNYLTIRCTDLHDFYSVLYPSNYSEDK